MAFSRRASIPVLSDVGPFALRQTPDLARLPGARLSFASQDVGAGFCW